MTSYRMTPSSSRPQLRLTYSRLAAWLDRVQPPEEAVLIGAALVVGVLGATGAMAFRSLVELWFRSVFVEAQVALAPALGRVGAVLLPAVLLPGLGGLVVGMLLSGVLSSGQGMGTGIASIMEAVALRGARLNLQRALWRVIGAMVTIGLGGSAGPEDPSVQLGAHTGSSLGQAMRLSDERLKTLVACGAAAGIAASFNAPFAAVFFALEVILGQITTAAFGVVVLSAIVSAVLTQAIVGPQPAFAVPEVRPGGAGEILLYLFLGAVAAVVAWIFIQAFYWIGDRVRGWGIPLPIKAAAGGLLVGMLGAAVAIGFNLRPEETGIFGIGYSVIEQVLQGAALAPGLIFALILIKPFATAITLGSGGQGGVIAPVLFIGALTGVLFSQLIVGPLFPGATAAPAAFALVGMAAVFAAALRAPITAILLLFEMTRDHRILLPLLFATVVSTLITERWHEPSVYTLTLLRRGIRLVRGQDVDVLAGLSVSEAMTQEPYIVRDEVELPALEQAFYETHQHSFPVLDRSDALVGIVSLQDLERAKSYPGWEKLKVGNISTRDLLVAYPDESVGVALRRLAVRDVGMLPVVSRREPGRLLGTIRRDEILKAYKRGVLRRQDMQQRADHLRLSQLAGADFLEFMIEPGSPADGVAVRDLELPEDVLLTAIRRGPITKFPHHTDVLHAGDSVLALARSQEAAGVLAALFKRDFGRPRLPPGPREAVVRGELPPATGQGPGSGEQNSGDQPRPSPPAEEGARRGDNKEAS